MILVDTSVWVDHFRSGNTLLRALLNDQQVLTHPFVIGELSLGALRNRSRIIDLLSKLPLAPIAEHGEVMETIVRHGLAATGIGWVDAHLIAAAFLGGARVLTADKALRRECERLGVAAS